jgi:triosephosphate isomerase
MNGTAEAVSEIKKISETAMRAREVDVGLCLPFILLHAALPFGRSLRIGAQDCSPGVSGAHTGCISAPMLQEAGADLVIVGHSERRRDQFETNGEVRMKAQTALAAGLTTIVCVGEDLPAREAGCAVSCVQEQLSASLPASIGDGELIVAYEPVWAIGSGRSATPDDISEMHTSIRKVLHDSYGASGADVRIIYGGSCSPDNCSTILALADVDGALVGRASLRSETFEPMIAAASAAVRQDSGVHQG